MCGRNMAKHLDPLIHAYAILLRLYPTSFQAEFADEMLAVFAATVTEAAGWQILARVCWREWRDAPVAIIRAHFEERRYSMDTSPNPLLDERISWAGLLAGLWPFLIFGPFTVLMAYPYPYPAWRDAAWVQTSLLILYLLPLAIGFFVGWAKRWPRWAYPYAGMALTLLTGGVTALLHYVPLLDPIWNGSAFAQLLTINAALLFVAGACVLLSRGWRPLRALYDGVRQDWTRLSFGLYLFASLMFAGVDHDEDPALTPAVFLPTVIVLFGALVYLRSTTTTRRALALVIGYAVAVLVRTMDGVWFYGVWGLLIMPLIILPALLALRRRPAGMTPAV